MSDITIKTVNSSYKSPNKVQETDWSTRKSGEKKERKEKEPPKKPVLESLGKTRKHSATNLQNQTNMKSRSGKAIQITQNDGTIVSEDKLPHNTTKKQNKSDNSPEKEDEVGIREDELSIMSECTTFTEKQREKEKGEKATTTTTNEKIISKDGEKKLAAVKPTSIMTSKTKNRKMVTM